MVRSGNGKTTLKADGALVPFVVVTVTSCAPNSALGEIVNVATALVELVTAMLLIVISLPASTNKSPANPVPSKVITTLVPGTPTGGVSKVRPGGGLTVNVMALLVPAEVVTVTSRAPGTAAAVIVNVTVVEVGLTTDRLLAVMPSMGLMTRDESNFDPLKLTCTTVPLAPEFGVMPLTINPN